MANAAYEVGELVEVGLGPNGGSIAEIVDVKPEESWGYLYKLSFAPGVFVAPGNEWQPDCMFHRSGK